MQEEVNQKTVALSIRTTKLTGKVLAAALGKVARALQKHHRKALTPQGRQSVKKLMNHYGGKSAMPYVGAPKDFDRIAKEFHVDYAFHKVSPGHYLLFFKANQADAITAAFQKYSAKVLNKEQDKPSILGQLRKFTEQIRTQAKEFHVDYAFHKVSPGHYLLFFKANQADAITAAFQKYSAKVLNKEQDKASILGQLRKFTEQIRTQAKEKQRTREAVKDGR